VIGFEHDLHMTDSILTLSGLGFLLLKNKFHLFFLIKLNYLINNELVDVAN
jgi:hypothetical protein